MNDLSAVLLGQVVRGDLRMSSLPPLGGAWEPVHSVRIDALQVQPGEVLLTGAGLDERAVGRRQFPEEAFARQAVGVVTSNSAAAPWAGTFVIHVPDARVALHDLARWNRRRYSGTLITLLGNVRGEKLADHLERLMSPLGTVQRIAFESPYDPVSVSMGLLELQEEADYVLTTVPVDDDESAAQASRLLRPNLALNCLRHTRYAEVASIREIRATMTSDSHLLTTTPLPVIAPVRGASAHVASISSENSGDINFRIDTQRPHRSLTYRDKFIFSKGPSDTTSDDDMLILGTCLHLGMDAMELQKGWRSLAARDSHRNAA